MNRQRLDYGWIVDAYVDEDCHLNIIIETNEPENITEIEVDADNKGWVRYRFTTKSIEDRYIKESNDE